MKIINYFPLSKLLITASLFIGCVDSEDYLPSTTKMIPARIVYFQSSIGWATRNVYELAYDSENRMTRIENYVETEQGDITETIAIEIISLSYEKNFIHSQITRFDDPDYDKTITYKHENSQIMVGEKVYAEIDDEFREVGPVYDCNGNSVKDQEYNRKYDQENGVFRYVNMPPWYLAKFNFLKNNIFNNCIEEEKSKSIYRYRMIYNSENYPIKIFKQNMEFLLGDTGQMNYFIDYITVN